VRSRKPEVLRLQAQDEDGVVHSLLSGLPDIYDMKRPDLHDDEPNMDQQTKLHNTSEEVAPKPAGEILSLDPEPKPEQDTVSLSAVCSDHAHYRPGGGEGVESRGRL
jgi:hypothetical protein